MESGRAEGLSEEVVGRTEEISDGPEEVAQGPEELGVGNAEANGQDQDHGEGGGEQPHLEHFQEWQTTTDWLKLPLLGLIITFIPGSFRGFGVVVVVGSSNVVVSVLALWCVVRGLEDDTRRLHNGGVPRTARVIIAVFSRFRPRL